MRRLVDAAIRGGRLLRFGGFYLWNLVAGNALIAREVLTPSSGARPAIVRIPVRAHSDLEITMLANLISLTPGTLTLDVAEDRSAIFVHALHVSSAEDLRAHIGKLEDRLLRTLR
ncbi:MAG: Na+/H+ antiporter subunit E [Actinomycetota bacterium]|nr:Na+/H+ antiporter subunit E [Actinomycetota bacterium]